MKFNQREFRDPTDLATNVQMIETEMAETQEICSPSSTKFTYKIVIDLAEITEPGLSSVIEQTESVLQFLQSLQNKK